MSSTYTDLIEERREVTEHLQRLRCIPAGMELFTASGLPPWSVIQAAIDDSDYVVLILGGRYGSSVDDDQRSYTEREYDYAVSQGIPVLPFLHRDIESLPARHVDSDPTAKTRRENFWAKVRDSGRHTVAFWNHGADLAQQVMAAVSAAIETQPRPGWVRGGDSTISRTIPKGRPDHSPEVEGEDLRRADEVREALGRRNGPARIERAVDDAVRQVRELPFLFGDGDYPGGQVAQLHAKRVELLQAQSHDLIRIVTAATRWGGQLDEYVLEAVRDLSAVPVQGGYTALVNLAYAPAVFMMTAAGVGACAGRRDDLVGGLLSGAVETAHPFRDEDVPAAAVLMPTLVYDQAWASRELRAHFVDILRDDPAWQGTVLDRAWEKWDYLAAVARQMYAETIQTSTGGMPYLRIEDRRQGGPRPVAARAIRKAVAAQGSDHPLLEASFCGGNPVVFDQSAEAFDVRYGAWGESQDWGALPNVGGVFGGTLPTGPHYPGDRHSNS